MAAARPHPFDLLFGTFRDSGFPAIRQVLGDQSERDAFLLAAPAIDLMRDIRPAEPMGDGVDEFVALVHASYLFWRDGQHTVALDEAGTRVLCSPVAAGLGISPPPLEPARTTYIQIAPRLVWAQPAADGPFEPLDGWFATAIDDRLRVVACLGVHPERPGVSVIVATGSPPGHLVRPDGTPLFAPAMPGGDAAGLHAIVMAEELILMAWRAHGNRKRD